MKKWHKLFAFIVAVVLLGVLTLVVNSQTNREVQVQIEGGENNCRFFEYSLIQTGISYDEQVVESNVTGYVCTMEAGGTDEYVSVKSSDLINMLVIPLIPAENIKIKHVDSASGTAGGCALTGLLDIDYANVASGEILFAKDDYSVCTVEGTTQLEITIPASLPVGVYTGNITFTIYSS